MFFMFYRGEGYSVLIFYYIYKFIEFVFLFIGVVWEALFRFYRLGRGDRGLVGFSRCFR